MTTNLGDAPRFPVRCTGKEHVISGCTIVCDGAGAVTSITKDDPAWTAVDGGGAGLLTLTLPAAAGASGARAFAQIEKGDGTVTEVIFTALSLTAGTATLRTSAAGTATDPEATCAIHVEVVSPVAP